MPNSSPFRLYYKRLAELHALIHSSVQFAVFTATASKTTKTRIFEALNLTPVNTFVLEKSPLKRNQLYSVEYVNKDLPIAAVFTRLIDDLKVKRMEAGRTLIFTQSRTQCSLIWRMFKLNLGKLLFNDGTTNPASRVVEMYHAGTPKAVKIHIQKEFARKESHLRYLVCTSAYGMGVDCKGVHRIVHFGPPNSLEAYIQETGRGGRDGKLSTCHLLYNGLLASRCNDDIKRFMYTENCRRLIVKDTFSGEIQEGKCTCCDVCSRKCACNNEECKLLTNFMTSHTPAMETNERRRRQVSDVQKEKLRKMLATYAEEFQKASTNSDTVVFPNVWLEFNDFQINQVLSHCEFLFTFDDVLDFVEIWKNVHAEHILLSVNEIFQDFEIQLDALQFNQSESHDITELNSSWLEIRDDSFHHIGIEESILSSHGISFESGSEIEDNRTEYLSSMMSCSLIEDIAEHEIVDE
eukprot:Seg832.4 transcript_id=Seg832.4/GoldUCD/mRNA.D3Y31 product="ATP-dependent DNA helicase RecQ" protein_id=Seg832.4/GoldUCD/D3Y31